MRVEQVAQRGGHSRSVDEALSNMKISLLISGRLD